MKSILALFIIFVVLFNVVYTESEESSESGSTNTNDNSNSKNTAAEQTASSSSVSKKPVNTHFESYNIEYTDSDDSSDPSSSKDNTNSNSKDAAPAKQSQTASSSSAPQQPVFPQYKPFQVKPAKVVYAVPQGFPPKSFSNLQSFASVPQFAELLPPSFSSPFPPPLPFQNLNNRNLYQPNVPFPRRPKFAQFQYPPSFPQF